jgi:hypothetical protein
VRYNIWNTYEDANNFSNNGILRKQEGSKINWAAGKWLDTSLINCNDNPSTISYYDLGYNFTFYAEKQFINFPADAAGSEAGFFAVSQNKGSFDNSPQLFGWGYGTFDRVSSGRWAYYGFGNTTGYKQFYTVKDYVSANLQNDRWYYSRYYNGIYNVSVYTDLWITQIDSGQLNGISYDYSTGMTNSNYSYVFDMNPSYGGAALGYNTADDFYFWIVPRNNTAISFDFGEIQNSEPIIPPEARNGTPDITSIYWDSVYYGSNLTCWSEVFDPINSTLNLDYWIYRNGILYQNDTIAINISIPSVVAVIDASNTSANQTWNCTARAYYELNYSSNATAGLYLVDSPIPTEWVVGLPALDFSSWSSLLILIFLFVVIIVLFVLGSRIPGLGILGGLMGVLFGILVCQFNFFIGILFGFVLLMSGMAITFKK